MFQGIVSDRKGPLTFFEACTLVSSSFAGHYLHITRCGFPGDVPARIAMDKIIPQKLLVTFDR